MEDFGIPEEEAFQFYYKYMKHVKQTASTLKNEVKDAWFFISLCVWLLANSSPHHVAVLTLRGAISVIELHALQGAMTAHTTETVGVEEFIHRSYCWLRTGQSLTTIAANL